METKDKIFVEFTAYETVAYGGPAADMLRSKLGTRPGTEEGQKCNVDGCPGYLGFEPVKHCTCFINPPCGPCVDNPLVCLLCGRTLETDN